MFIEDRQPAFPGKDVKFAIGDGPDLRIGFHLAAARELHRAETIELRRVMLGVGRKFSAVLALLNQYVVSSKAKPNSAEPCSGFPSVK